MSAAAGPVDLWIIDTDQPAPVLAGLARLLDPAERDPAAATLDPVEADRFIAVHGIVRLLTAERLGVGPADLVWRYGPHGKPEPDGADGRLRLSYSASGPLAVLALAEGRRVGADVEELRDERVATRMSRRYFPPSDQQFLLEADGPAAVSDRFTRLWCRREAVVKLHGGRLAQGLGLSLAGTGPLLLAEASPLGKGPCRVLDASVPGAFRAAVAAEGAGPLLIRRRFWTAPADLFAPSSPCTAPRPVTAPLLPATT